MLCSSLELYCPLNNGDLTNHAQSMNTIQLISNPSALEETHDKMVNNQTANAYNILGQPVEPSFRGGVLIVNGEKVLR